MSDNTQIQVGDIVKFNADLFPNEDNSHEFLVLEINTNSWTGGLECYATNIKDLKLPFPGRSTLQLADLVKA